MGVALASIPCWRTWRANCSRHRRRSALRMLSRFQVVRADHEMHMWMRLVGVKHHRAAVHERELFRAKSRLAPSSLSGDVPEGIEQNDVVHELGLRRPPRCIALQRLSPASISNTQSSTSFAATSLPTSLSPSSEPPWRLMYLASAPRVVLAPPEGFTMTSGTRRTVRAICWIPLRRVKRVGRPGPRRP